MDTKTFKFQGKYYTSNQGWGLAHPKYNYWYDPECILITKDTAILGISNTPYSTYKWGAGQMVSKKHYQYGTFEWEYMLPKGKNLWPAIWLTSVDSWPPEIDVMEGWTSRGVLLWKDRKDYLRLPLFSNIHPSIYLGTGDNPIGEGHGSLGTNNATYSCFNNINKVNKCKLEWTPEYIKVKYNGHKVMEITDKEKLKELNVPMRVIMNSAVTEDFTQEDYEDYKSKGRPFIILSFKYERYEE